MSIATPPDFSDMPAESQPTLAEIRSVLGFVPPALGAVARDPAALRSAWQITRTGYIENTLPALFKERFMAVMAKYNQTPYSLIVRSCSLRRMGMTAKDIVHFLRTKLPPQRLITEQLRIHAARWVLRSGWSSIPPELEPWILWAAARFAVRKDPGGRCRTALAETLGDDLFNRVVTLCTFAAMQRVWIDAHPEFDAMDDARVIEQHKALLKECPEFAHLWDSARKRSRRRIPGPRERRLLAEIARQDRVREALRDSERRFRKVVQSMPFPVMVYAADGEIVMLNRAWTQGSGWDQKDIPTMEDWFHKAQHDENRWEAADVESLYDWPEPVEEGEQTVYTASGQTRTWDFATTYVGKLADGRQALIRTAVDVSERHRLQSALWETNTRISGIVEAITDGFIAMDRETRFLYYNRQAERVLKVKSDEVLGKRFLDVFTISENAPLYQAILRCLNDGVTQHVEHYSERVNTVYEVHLYPAAEGLSAYIRDIGERKRMEQALRESERKFRGLYESGMIGIMFANRFSGEIIDCNDALLKIVGFGREDVEAGRLNWIELTAPEDRHLDAKAVDEVGRGPLVPYEKHYVHKDGHRVPILIGGAPVIHDEAVVMAFVIDRTAQKESERRVEEVHSLLDAVLQATPLPTNVLDLEGNNLIWNRASEEVFGWTAEEALGKRPPVVLPEDRERFEAAIATIRSGKPFSAPAIPCLKKDGTIVHVQVEGRPVCDPSGKVIALMSIVHPASLKDTDPHAC